MISSGWHAARDVRAGEQTEGKYLKETIVAVRKDVEAGLSLSTRWPATEGLQHPVSSR